MPLWKRTQHSFAAGQLDKSLMGRQDLDKYLKGATKLENMFVKRQGCIQKRRGTDLTADLEHLLGYEYDGVTPIAAGKMRLVPVNNDDEGRYAIISNKTCFVASREGVLTADKRHVRSIDRYIAVDQDGRPVTNGDKDLRQSLETPFDVIHRIGPGNYSVMRYATLQEAFDATQDGDTVRMHSNVILSSNVYLRSSTWHTQDGTGTATATFDPTTSIFTVRYNGSNYWEYGHHYYEETKTLKFPTRYITATRKWTFSDGNTYAVVSDMPNSSRWKVTRNGNTYYSNERNHPDTFTMTVGGATVTATCSWQYSGTDYDPSKTYTITKPGSGASWPQWTLSDGTNTYKSKVGVNYYQTTVQFGTNTITIVRDPKTVTFDLYGYKLTVNSTSAHIHVRMDGVKLIVDSARPNAEIVCPKYGNNTIFNVHNGNDEHSGQLELNGDILYTLMQSGNVVNSYLSPNVTVNAGTFVIESGSPDYGIVCFTRSIVTINGGKFYARGSSNRVVGLPVNSGGDIDMQLTINGGIFDATKSSGTDNLIDNTAGLVVLNGGQFVMPESANGKFFRSGFARGDSRFENVLKITRGEFSSSNIVLGFYSNVPKPIEQFIHDGSVLNEIYPNGDGYYGVKIDGEGDYFYWDTRFGSVPYRIAVPYEDEDLADICIRQSGDTLFLAHRSYPPAKIYFDTKGFAHFEELQFDNTEVLPPQIDSAEMVGQEEKETDWPEGFDQDLKTQAKALGTVTDAGKNSNSTTGSDGSGTSATTYTATAVSKNRLTGRKTTTVLVKSVTSSTAIEREVQYVDGQPVGYTSRAISTSGSAQNNASASSVIVGRTVRYVATYIKDGKESRPSQPVAIDYDMPWANNAVVNIEVSKGNNRDEADYYNIYKDNGNGYGLIGTVDLDRSIGSIQGFVDTYPLFIPESGKPNIMCVADFEEARGLATGDILRKLLSIGRDKFSTSAKNDIALISTASNQANGMVFDLSQNHGVTFNKIRVMLDARIYDPEMDASYVIVSTPYVTARLTYYKPDGTTGTISKTMTTPVRVSLPNYGFRADGIYEDWISLSRRAFTAPNGDTIYAWLYGKGDQTENFNNHLRAIDFDFSNDIRGLGNNFASVKEVKFTFSQSVYSDWTNNQQGCIHAIHFYNDTTNGTGTFQDDYINPDMTVTPPLTDEEHFSSADNYPGAVGIYEQRLVFASTNNDPSTLWMSRIADILNFTPHDSIREDDALELAIAATEFPKINHILMGRNMMLLADGGEWEVAPVTGNALTYKTASCKLQSMIGTSRSVQPLQINDEIIFVERSGCAIRSTNYDFTSESYKTKDLSVLCQSIFRNNAIVSMAYKQHPDSVIECVLSDGTLATLVYMPEQEVAAWSHHTLGGGWKAKEIVTPKCIVNGTTEMMILVEKDGVYQMWKVRDDDDAPTAAAQAVMDGARVGTLLDSSGDSVSVPIGGGKFLTGHRIDAEMVTVRPEPDQGATAQFEIKNATECEVRVIDASTFSLKPFAIQEGWREEQIPVVEAADGTVTLTDRDVKKLMTGTNNRDGRIHLKHSAPWPLTVLSVSTTYQIEYENTPSGSQEGQQ